MPTHKYCQKNKDVAVHQLHHETRHHESAFEGLEQELIIINDHSKVKILSMEQFFSVVVFMAAITVLVLLQA